MEDDAADVTEIDEKTGEIRIKSKIPVHLNEEIISDSENFEDLLPDVKIKSESTGKRKPRSSTSGAEDLEKTDEEKLFE